MDKIKLLPLFLNSLVAIAAASGVYLNAGAIDSFLSSDFLNGIASFFGTDLLTEKKSLAGLLTLLGPALASSGAFGWVRRVRTRGRVEMGNYFDQPTFTDFPAGRMGYSDRLSYTLAELADLAYWDVCDEDFYKDLEAIKEIAEAKGLDLKSIARATMNTDKETTPEKFDEALARGGFKAIERAIRVNETQCFVCVHEGFGDASHRPYIVVAFRGSEKKIDDWLTNADAVPATDFNTGP